MTAASPSIVAGSSSLFEANPMAFLLSRHREHGDVFAVELDGVPTVIFGGLGGPATLFRAERDYLAVYNTPLVHELFGQAIFNLVGEPHRQARALLRQAVSDNSLRELTPTLTALVARHVARWSDHDTFDLHEASRELTLEVCARLILGLPCGSDDDQMFSATFAAFIAAAESDSNTRKSSPVFQCGLAAAKHLRAIIGRRVTATANTAGQDVLSRLAARSEPVPSDIGDHLLAVMIAARETTASLLTWVLIELAQTQDTAHTAADEFHALGSSVSPTLQAVLWETERRHSPNILSRRTVVKEFATPYGVVPQGWHAAYSPAANHLFPDLFDDPHRFLPARFAGQAGRPLATSLLTFGRGIHACPGKSLAELIAATVSAITNRFHRLELVSPPPEQVRFLPVKSPAHPVLASLRPRRTP